MRFEFLFCGFYTSANQVQPPISPVDDYAYAMAECLFVSIPYSSLPPASGFVPGQVTVPVRGTSLGSGNITGAPDTNWVDPDTGVLNLSYYFAGNGQQFQGTAAVYAACQRFSAWPN